MNITALLRAIFMRPEFRLATTRNALVRSPVEWMVATMRHLGMDAADPPSRVVAGDTSASASTTRPT